MNQQQAESVKHLAKSVVKTLRVIMKRKCPECKGIGASVAYVKDGEGKRSQVVDCYTCNGTGKVGWKWKPKIGEFFLDSSTGTAQEISVIEDIKYKQQEQQWWIETHGNWWPLENIDQSIIPILHWETLETVLEEVGYKLTIGYTTYGHDRFTSSIGSGGKIIRVIAEGKSRQEAVMKAVIKLGEKLNG